VQHLVRLAREPDLTPLYADAWLVVCDSRILELLGQARGLKLRAAPRIDMIERLLAGGVDPADSLTIIGGTAAVIEAVKARYDLTAVHWHDPPQGLRDKPGAIADAAAFAAAHPSKITLIAVGSPQQEMVARAIMDRGDAVGVGLCVGSSLDLIAASARPAPGWMRKIGLGGLHQKLTRPKGGAGPGLADRIAILGLWFAQLRRRKA
jgi:N-acetylglucosaminyldiphosphoundecaprenol N-acetyl-beta-D-mannosaminyltransferase